MWDDQIIEQQAEFFKCIGDPTCLKLLHILINQKEACVSDITAVLGISMPAVSHQLKKLRNMGLVEKTRDGQMICYSLAKNERAKMIKKLLKKTSERLRLSR